ncbi:hypothetical protein [Paraburkholderia sp. D1E]|uniref:hypothetical protein n=1 Tax=Paraburkholderia sp. D1E TaxID=3461398 RepID=UPI004045DF2A
MAWINKDKSKGEKADKKPAATFWDDPAPAKSGKEQHSKVEEAGHVFGFNPDLELQTQIGGSSREYGQQAINASVANANEQPTSRARIEHAMRPRSSIYHDGLFHLSTHRAARGEGRISEEERETLIETAERKAYAGLMHILDLFAR